MSTRQQAALARIGRLALFFLRREALFAQASADFRGACLEFRAKHSNGEHIPRGTPLHEEMRHHAALESGAFAVYWTKDVNTVFRRFVGECVRVTAHFATHPDIEDRFRLKPGVAAKEAA